VTFLGLELLRPELVWAPLVAGPLFCVGLYGLVRRRGDLAKLVDARRLRRFVPGRSRSRPLARLVLATSAALLLGLSLMGPVRGFTLREVHSTGLDIVVCIDTSRSMLARDLRPSRLERARREVRGLLDAMRGDRAALVAFAGSAREVAPLTSDRRALEALLERVSPDDNRQGGTDLSAALERALAMFDGRTGAHEAVVMLTDGEDLAGEGLAMAAEAARRGIRVFVVGVGTPEGGKIPVTGPGGERFLVGPEGDEVVTRLDEPSLRQVAELTGGNYVSVLGSATPLEDLYGARIARLEGRELTSGMQRVPHDRYQWALLLAVLCMLGEVGLRERRPRPRTNAFGGVA
jgi:Ca-activated chloride channel family protein